jgi:LysR family nod box-dependent transcriptional activator
LNLTNVDLNLLVALDALLRERNVTRAGRLVGLSQPAMSATLARLRALFDDPLLARVGREYRLTPRANELMEPLRSALEAVERTLQRSAPFDPATAKRRFRIAVSDHLMVVLLPPLIQHLREVAPGIQLHVRQVSPEISKDLNARRVDLSLQPSGLLPDVATQDLFVDRWVCAVWEGNETVKQRITIDQLCSLAHASFSVGRPSLAERYLEPHLSQPLQIAVTCQSFTALPFLIRGTQMVTLVQHTLAARVQRQAEIRLLEPPVPITRLMIAMCWSSSCTTDPAHTWLRQTVADIAKQHGKLPAFEPAE